MTPSPGNSPIFILGILHRSGTNFLYDLLREHPDCRVADPIWEDFLLYPADQLMSYTRSVYHCWDPAWGIDEGFRQRICRHLGDGMLSFLSNGSGKRLLTKTPSVRNLDAFFQLFPEARLLIVVRDGRAVVESGHKTFGWNYEGGMLRWTEAARTIVDFDRQHRDRNLPYRIVRYEDLCSGLEQELRSVLEFLELDPAAYDFGRAANLPVRGSSTLSDGKKDVHWKPVAKTADFNPLDRFQHWSPALTERFRWIAGRAMIELGYEDEAFVQFGTVSSWKQRALDFKRKLGRMRRLRQRPPSKRLGG